MGNLIQFVSKLNSHERQILWGGTLYWQNDDDCLILICTHWVYSKRIRSIKDSCYIWVQSKKSVPIDIVHPVEQKQENNLSNEKASLSSRYLNADAKYFKHSLPHIFPKHGLHTPPRTKDVQGLWETVVVYQASINGEQAHHQDDVTPLKEHVPDLHVHIRSVTFHTLNSHWKHQC